MPRKSKGTRAKSKKRLARLEEGYPKRDPKTGKVTTKKGKSTKGSRTVRDRKYQQAKLKKEL